MFSKLIKIVNGNDLNKCKKLSQEEISCLSTKAFLVLLQREQLVLKTLNQILGREKNAG